MKSPLQGRTHLATTHKSLRAPRHNIHSDKLNNTYLRMISELYPPKVPEGFDNISLETW